MFEAFIERNTRIAKSNQVLIALRLLFATIALAVLIIRENDLLQSAPLDSITPLYYRPPGFVALVVLALTIVYLTLVRSVGSTGMRWRGASKVTEMLRAAPRSSSR